MDNTDNTIKQTIVLAKLHVVMDMQIHILDERKKLEVELKNLELAGKKDKGIDWKKVEEINVNTF